MNCRVFGVYGGLLYFDMILNNKLQLPWLPTRNGYVLFINFPDSAFSDSLLWLFMEPEALY